MCRKVLESINHIYFCLQSFSTTTLNTPRPAAATNLSLHMQIIGIFVVLTSCMSSCIPPRSSLPAMPSTSSMSNTCFLSVALPSLLLLLLARWNAEERLDDCKYSATSSLRLFLLLRSLAFNSTKVKPSACANGETGMR